MTDAASTRLAERLALLDNGYTPLPLEKKACYLPKWTSVKVDAATVQGWPKDAWPNTGVRCDRVFAIDLDIDDAEVGAEAFEMAQGTFGPSPLVRCGRAPKLLLVYRPKGPHPGKRQTGRWVDAEGKVHAVEVLGRGHQFAAIGMHPKARVPYTWADGSPLTVPRSALPTIDAGAVQLFVEAIVELFAARGWSRVVAGAGARQDGSFGMVTDLSDDLKLAVLKPESWAGEWEVGDLERAMAGSDDSDVGVRLCMSAFRPGADGDSGMARVSEEGRLRVVDFVDRVVHQRPVAGQEIRGAPPEIRAAVLGEQESVFRELLERWVYVASEDACYRLEDPAVAYTRTAMGVRARGLTYDGKPMTRAWLDHPEARRVDARRFNPRVRGVFEAEAEGSGCWYLSTYRPPRFPGEGGSVGVWNDFMGHLVPREDERAVVLDWCATLVQRPWERMWAILMMADGVFGAGRGTLATILSRLVGEAYAIEQTFDVVSGRSNQSQYGDWLYETLLVSVPEVFDEKLDHEHRVRAYERLKTLIDPGGGRRVALNLKGSRVAREEVYASVLLATNHDAPIQLVKGDRRVYVVENGPAMPEGLCAALYGGEAGGGWLSDAANLGALERVLRARKVEAAVSRAPPTTEAKRRLVRAGESELDAVWADFLETVEPKFFTADQLKRFARALAVTTDLDVSDDLGRALKGGYLRARGCRRDEGNDRVQMRKRRVRFFRAPGSRRTTLDRVRRELERVDDAIDAAMPVKAVAAIGG